MMELQVPSINFRSIGGTEYITEVQSCTNLLSIKQWVDPESTSARIVLLVLGMLEIERGIRSEFGSERADALSLKDSVAQLRVTQPSVCTEDGGLRTIFLVPRELEQKPGRHGLSLC